MKGNPMLSRAADSVYWLSRYIERVENTARFIDVNLHMTLDLPAGIGEQWVPQVAVSGDADFFNERYSLADKNNVIRFLTFDEENPNSILCCLRSARENARTIREVLSSEMWEQLNKLYLMVNAAASGSWTTDSPYHLLHEVRTGCRLFAGLAEGTMLRNEGWHFMRLGRMLERADKTSRILDVKYFILLPSVDYVGSAIDDIQWAAVLKSVSAFEMYRRQYGRIAPNSIVDFLLLDREFPRAIHFCILTAAESLHAISGSAMGTFANPAEQRLGMLLAELNYTQVSEVITAGLHEFLDSLQRKMNNVDDAIYETFFALRPVGSDVA
jgi:uncharacterized alpha-E superfamily protein